MPSKDHPPIVKDYLSRFPDTETVDLLVPDMNGILRGKRIPVSDFAKAVTKGVPYPGSSETLTVKGQAIDALGEGTRDGDPDHLCRAVPETLSPVPWAQRPTAQMMMALYEDNGTPFYADPRHVLERAGAPLRAMGLNVMVALELEFYLLDARALPPRPAQPPVHFPPLDGAQCYSLDSLYDFQDFLQELGDVTAAQKIPASSTLSEYGDSQFEINLHHVDDPVRACDQALLLKRAIKGIARRHGLLACFMAKPFMDQPGNGLHAHISLYTDEGRNIFAASGGNRGFSDEIRHAIGGLSRLMGESMALFAPNANSYRRFRPGNYVPLSPSWGVNHRGVALRLPLADAENTRIEHRVAGADANPYLVLAAILAGIHHGLSEKIDPGPMTREGEGIDETITLPVRWDAALDAFERSAVLPAYLGERYARTFAICRRAEAEMFHAEISDRDYSWYLRNV